MPICQKCKASYPNRIVVDGKERNLSNRRFCVQCSPFGRHNTHDLTVAHVPRCLRCQIEIDHSNAYKKSGKTYLLSYCRDCFNYNALERVRRIKQQCLDYKGGRCIVCGYDRCTGALEFHHLELEAKELQISSVRSRTFERIKAELDKCVLVCCRCHREIHAGLIELPSAAATSQQKI
jgi:hypothetical protein